MDNHGPGTDADGGLACLVLLARLHGLPADAARLRHALALARGEPCDAATLVRAARLIGLQARRLHADPARLARLPLPALARRRDGRWCAIGRAAGERVQVHDAGAAPRALSTAELAAAWDGELVLVRRREPRPGPARRFGAGWFLPAIARYRHLLGEVLLASLCLQLFALATPLAFQIVVDKVLAHRALATLDVLAGGLLAVTMFEALLAGLRGYVLAHTAQRIDATLGARVFAHLLRLPVAYFAARRTGDTVARVRELETLRHTLTSGALTLAVDVVFTVVFFAVMWLYSVPLTLLVLATVPVYVTLAAAITPVLRARLEERFERGADSHAFLVETVTGIETLKAAAVEPQIRRRWEDKLAAYARAAFRAAQAANVGEQSAACIGRLTAVAVLWLGAREVIAGAMTVGQLVAFNMLAARVAAPVLRLAQLWQELQQARIAVHRLGDILDAAPEPAAGAGRATLPRPRGAIRFEHVTFRYRPDGPEALADLCLEIAAGEVLGIAGPSGSGKSTLCRLVQRLYVPQSGRVRVDGADLALIEPVWLRRNLGVVLQENMLFNRSVRENIALADPALPIERVVQAAKLAGAHDFILELPEGYDTVLGEHGTGLSGGQRQRIALARALVTDPAILVLDEATSALDYESEAVIQRNMRYICKGRTVLVIAHRLSALRCCDRIVVLERGRVAEQGTHRELLARGGRYARLHAAQHAGAV